MKYFLSSHLSSAEAKKVCSKCFLNDIMYYFNFVWTIILSVIGRRRKQQLVVLFPPLSLSVSWASTIRKCLFNWIMRFNLLWKKRTFIVTQHHQNQTIYPNSIQWIEVWSENILQYDLLEEAHKITSRKLFGFASELAKIVCQKKNRVKYLLRRGRRRTKNCLQLSNGPTNLLDGCQHAAPKSPPQPQPKSYLVE